MCGRGLQNECEFVVNSGGAGMIEKTYFTREKSVVFTGSFMTFWLNITRPNNVKN